MDEQLRNTIASGRPIFWVPAASLVAVVAIGASLLWWNSDRQFDSMMWKNNPHLRSGMVRDLLDRYQLVGMTLMEVDELLGRPTGQDTLTDDSYVYRTGTSGMDDMWLEIDFAKGIATATRHVPD